jgi:hypothetical protein
MSTVSQLRTMTSIQMVDSLLKECAIMPWLASSFVAYSLWHIFGTRFVHVNDLKCLSSHRNPYLVFRTVRYQVKYADVEDAADEVKKSAIDKKIVSFRAAFSEDLARAAAADEVLFVHCRQVCR